MNLKSKSIVEIVKHERKLTYFEPVVCRCQHEIPINQTKIEKFKPYNFNDDNHGYTLASFQ